MGNPAIHPFAARMRTVGARAQARACCPACAASVGRRRPLAAIQTGNGRHAWLGLVGVAAALVPLAAMEETGSGDAIALAATAPIERAVVPAAPVEATSEEDVDFEFDWPDSVAHGTPNAGRLSAAALLPLSGDGYYTYSPLTGTPPNDAERRYGTTLLVTELVELGKWWEATYPGAPRLGIGDLSKREGGPFRDAHLSHQNGLDVDIRLPRTDGVEGRSHPGSYDRARTQAIVDRVIAQGAELVLIGPNLDLRGPSGVVVRWPNHDDHLHVRWPDPDGLGN